MDSGFTNSRDDIQNERDNNFYRERELNELVVKNFNSLQQLKAEIASAVVQFDACNHPSDFLPWIRNRIGKWRQLSAV